MTQWVRTHQPCPCGESSDAYAIAKDGHGFCFSCGKPHNKEKEVVETTYTYEYLPRRNITAETHQFFGVQTQIDSSGKPVSVAYVYPNGAAQIKNLDPPTKNDKFRSTGPMTEASGWAVDKFPSNSAKAITITEGNDDAMSAWQMLGKYPVYAIRSASTALRDVRTDYEHLNSFEKIYLCLDSDEPGRRAAQQIASVFGYGKVYNVNLAPLKDATEFCEQKREREFRNIWFNATRYMPETVVSSFADLKAALAASTALVAVPWPWTGLEQKLKGIRLHKLYLLSGLEGIGKTEVHHELIKYLAEVEPEAGIGIIHLEETHVDTMKVQAAKRREDYRFLEEGTVTNDEILAAYVEFAARDDRIHLYRHASSDDPDSLCSTIRFLVVACGCKYVFFDNYQKAAQLMTADRSTEVLDYLSSQFESLVKELPFSLFCISHENDNELTRGSRNVSKTCDVWINIKRDIKNESNVQYLTIFKNRPASRSGPAGSLVYDLEKATLSELTGELPS